MPTEQNHINHITLSTGHLYKSPRSGVGDEILAVLHPYLAQVIARPGRHPLPVASLSHYSLRASVEDKSLLATVYAPSGPHVPGQHALGGEGVPLVTFGVAQRPGYGSDLWAKLAGQFGALPGLEKPLEPWLAVAIHPGLALHSETAGWLGDFERCVAWAWVTRNPDLGAVCR